MNYLDSLKEQFNNKIAIRERRPGIYQLVVPLFHEDGDMVDIYLESKDGDGNRVRVCDHGMTLMRLSYAYELDTPNKGRIFHRILTENRVGEDRGNLYIDVPPDELYPAILQFAQVVAKVANMELYKREVIESLFYELVAEFVETSLGKYNPRPNVLPLPKRDDLEVDWQFEIKPRPVYLFASKDTSKARLATISCLEFQRAQLPFKSFVVHEDFENLPRKDRNRITSAADKQFITLDDFRENADQVLQREVA